MWLSRRAYERTMLAFQVTIRSLREELAGERAARGYAMQRLREQQLEHHGQTEELRRRLAVSQANFEWLTVSFNQANAERVAMFNSKMATQLQSLRVDTGEAPRFVDDTAVQRGAADGPLQPARARGPVDDILDARDGLSFDDIGDSAAAREGLNGRVYRDPADLLT